MSGGSRAASRGHRIAHGRTTGDETTGPPDRERVHQGRRVNRAAGQHRNAAAESPEGAPARRNPLHVLAGSRGDVLIANSLHRRVFPRALATLDGLGNPWFRAGDAVRDPVQNLRAIAGFEPPAELGRSA